MTGQSAANEPKNEEHGADTESEHYSLLLLPPRMLENRQYVHSEHIVCTYSIAGRAQPSNTGIQLIQACALPEGEREAAFCGAGAWRFSGP